MQDIIPQTQRGHARQLVGGIGDPDYLINLFKQAVPAKKRVGRGNRSSHRLATSVCDFTKLREIRNQFRSKVRPSGGTSKLNVTGDGGGGGANTSDSAVI